MSDDLIVDLAIWGLFIGVVGFGVSVVYFVFETFMWLFETQPTTVAFGIVLAASVFLAGLSLIILHVKAD